LQIGTVPTCAEQPSARSRQPGHASVPAAQAEQPSKTPQCAPSARVAALHKLLVDLARVPEAKAAEEILPKLLELFWHELQADALSDAMCEFFLHRLAEDFGHGTLRREHAGRLAARLAELGVTAVLDPLAHTGFHTRLLEDRGLRVEASDLNPPAAVRLWREVLQRPVDETKWECYGNEWALFLSWLPHWSEMGVEALGGFRGHIVVVLGDTEDWTGTDGFRAALERDWLLLDRIPTRGPWPRVDENLCVYMKRSHAASRIEGHQENKPVSCQ